MWYAKMYVSGRHEIFEFDAYGVQGAPSTKKVLPFLESLLSFLELDCDELTPMLQKLGDSWEHRITKDDREAGTAAMMELGKLAARHIYFRLLYVRWFERMNRMELDQDWGSEEDWNMLSELRQLPEQLPRYQEQIQRFFDLVLDVDKAGRDPQKQAFLQYRDGEPIRPGMFAFRPIPLSFEPVESDRCASVLYASELLDMIDYSLRSCVERGITVRRCKSCGRYFPQTGRVSAEYCERPVAEGQQTCRERGASQAWELKRSNDLVFKAYLKEYKKRFARIKAGKLTQEEFSAWSEQAREKRSECDEGALTLKEFERWLKES